MKRYPLVDVMKYVAAILVILVHCGRLHSNPVIHFALKSLLCRLAVPFFFISTAYVLRERMSEPVYFASYCRKLFRSYCWWSFIYLPLGIFYVLNQLDLPVWMYPAAFFAGFFVTGAYYHLWYIPALVIGFGLALYLQKKLGYVLSFFIAGTFYLFGGIETYSGYLEGSWLKSAYDFYRIVFFSPRNGLMFALVFILLGFLLSDRKISISCKKLSVYTMLSVTGLLFEGWLIYQNQGYDKNILFAHVPVSCCLILWATKNVHVPTHCYLAPYSKHYYFIHPLILYLMEQLPVKWDAYIFGDLTNFIFGLVSTHIVSWVIIRNRHRYQVIRTLCHQTYTKIRRHDVKGQYYQRRANKT